MHSKMALLTKPRSSFFKTLTLTLTLPSPSLNSSISTSSLLNQEPQLADPPPPPQPPSPSPLPPNPSSGNPLYSQNWRNPIHPSTHQHSLIPVGHFPQSPPPSFASKKDANALMNLFADWITSHRFKDVKETFEFWVKSFDVNGKLNKPNVDLFNHYLRAHYMDRASAGDLLDVVSGMEGFAVTPNTASFNIVLKAMHRSREVDAADKLLQRYMKASLVHQWILSKYQNEV